MWHDRWRGGGGSASVCKLFGYFAMIYHLLSLSGRSSDLLLGTNTIFVCNN